MDLMRRMPPGSTETVLNALLSLFPDHSLDLLSQLPAIEVLSALPHSPSINLLVMCPIRELTNQVAAEARELLKYHHSLGVQVVIGGTRLPQEQRSMQSNPCQILVATPGRLKDHLENTPVFSTRIKGVKVLVLDEADRLLDMGFRRDIEKIIAFIPKERQTLLFSATVPEEVPQISHVAMKKDHEFINTVQEGDEETHSQVNQTYMVAPLDLHFSILYNVLKKHVAEDADYKFLHLALHVNDIMSSRADKSLRTEQAAPAQELLQLPFSQVIRREESRRPRSDDVDAVTRLSVLDNPFYRDLCEFGAMFAIANKIDTVHKLPWIGFQSWRGAGRKWDIRGNAHGLLATHPIAPFISIHHAELVDPIYPGLSSLESLDLFNMAMKMEPMSFLQRSICYDQSQKLTFAISLGYVVEVYPNVLLPRELE